MAILCSTNPYMITEEESQRFSERLRQEADRLYGPQWMRKACWYFAYPAGIVVLGLWIQNLAVGLASFLISWGISAGSNALYGSLYKKKLEAAMGPAGPTEWQVFIEDEALVGRSLQIENRYRWDYFRDVETTDHYIIVRQSPLFQIMVPKRAFNSEVEIAPFVALLKQKIGSGKH